MGNVFIYLAMKEGCDEHEPRGVSGSQYANEGPDPEVVEGGQEKCDH